MFRSPDLTPATVMQEMRCDTIDPGTNMLGVVVGPMVPVRTHTFRKISKPCLAYATGGALRCWCSEHWTAPRDIAYIPVLNREMEYVVVLLAKTAAATIRNVQEGALLRFTRPDKAKSRIRITAVSGTDANQLWVREAQKIKGVQIMEFLCHMWQIHSLTRHLGFDVRQPNRVNPDPVRDPNATDAPPVSMVEKLLSERADQTEAA